MIAWFARTRLLLLGLALCLGCERPDTARIVFWRTLTGPAGETLDALTAAYSEEPGAEAVFQGGYGALALKLRTAAAARRGPDVTMLGTFEIRTFAEQGLLADLSPFLAGEHGLDTAGWPESMTGAGRVGEGVYWLPYNVSVPVLYWNEEAFASAGIAPPETWSDFFAAARTLTQRDPSGRITRRGLALWNITWPAVSMIWSEGGSLCTADYGAITLDDPVAVHVLSELQALVREGAALMPDAASGGHRAQFKSGQAAMILDSQAVFGEVMRDSLGFTPRVALFPAGSAGRVFAPGGGGLAMSADTPPERRQAAWAFMRYLLEPESLSAFSEASGYLAFSKEAQALAPLRNETPYATLYEAFAHVRGDFSLNAMPPVRDAFDRAFQRIVTDPSSDVRAILEEADRRAEAGAARWLGATE